MSDTKNLIVNAWDLRDIIAISCITNLNSNHAIKKIESSANWEQFKFYNDLYKVSNYFSDIELFKNSKPDIFNEADRILDKCSKDNIQIITFWDEYYPKLLKKIDFPPLLLYVKGELSSNDKPVISMVGTRHCTEYGKMVAERFSETFAKEGVIVCSGLATGIDTYSHFSTINAGGITYAVIASSIDKISPQISQMNAEKIVDSGGCVISTYKPGTNALPPYFLQRNRIISGISMATVIVESAYKGGSLNTARNAFEQNREVYAVPGKINSERSKGTNNLIKKNIANIAISPEDILKDLGLIEAENIFKNKRKNIPELTADQKILYEVIDSEPIHIDDIAERTSMEIPQILSVLLSMEFAGLVKQLPGKHFIKLNL